LKIFIFSHFAAFLREVLSNSPNKEEYPKILTTLFCSVFLRDPPNTNHGSGIQAKTSRQMLTNKKFDFLHHFLVNDKEN